MLMLVYLFALGLTLSLPVAPLDRAPVCGQLPISSTSISLLPFPETFSGAWEFFSVSVTCSLEIIRISALQGHPGASVRDRNQWVSILASQPLTEIVLRVSRVQTQKKSEPQLSTFVTYSLILFYWIFPFSTSFPITSPCTSLDDFTHKLTIVCLRVCFWGNCCKDSKSSRKGTITVCWKLTLPWEGA